MKTRTILLALLVSIGFAFTAESQENTKIGGMLAYGTEIENVGIGVNAEFPIMEKLTIAPSFIYFLPKDFGPIKINWFEFSANANYYFLSQPNLSVYGLGGLNYTSVKTKWDNTFFGQSASASDGRFGLNIGGGANFDIGSSITPFAELKYVIMDGGQLVLAAGVKFSI